MSALVEEKLYSKKEAAAALRLSEITIHRLIRRGRLGAYKFGARVFVGASHLDAFKQSVERRAKAA
jgi:excisionase family DNA binding protein